MKPTSVDVFWDIGVFLYRIKAPYDAPLIDEFKKAIPGQCRTWDKPTKTWVFEEDYLDVALHVYDKYQQRVRTRAEVEREARAALPVPEDVDRMAKAATAFIAHLDDDVLTKAFKLQAAKTHPDKGGNADAFSEFNSAYQYILSGRK